MGRQKSRLLIEVNKRIELQSAGNLVSVDCVIWLHKVAEGMRDLASEGRRRDAVDNKYLL